MAQYSFETIKTLLNRSIENGWEAKLTLRINSRDYMIIIYNDHCSFQRIGRYDRSGEYNFSSLEELYKAQQIDEICLEKKKKKIEAFDCLDFELQGFI